MYKIYHVIVLIHCLVSYREVLSRVQTFADKLKIKTNMASAV